MFTLLRCCNVHVLAQYPLSLSLAADVLLALLIELWPMRRRPWAMPAFLVYVMIFAWYYADPLLYSAKYSGMSDTLFDESYYEVILFLVAFRISMPLWARWLLTSQTARSVKTVFNPELLLKPAIGLWIILFVCGLDRMDWNVMDTLLPINSRAGVQMWQRAAAGDAGALGALVSSAGYVYLVASALFGVIAVLARRPSCRLIASGMIVLTWPYFLLGGSRNQFLAVATPGLFCYFLMGRQKLAVRVIMLSLALLLLNSAFLVVVSRRNIGFREFLAGTEDPGQVDREQESGHEGLNMIQELCYINSFVYLGQINLTLGRDYFAQAANIVPRALWPGKPMMGIEYAKLRGYGGGSGDTGVIATISTGIIGQGVLEFGPFFGAIAPAALMSLWCIVISRWWVQRTSILRLFLFLLGLSTIFNLGRDLTSLTLWPVAFAYVFVWLPERYMRSHPEYALLGIRRVAHRRPAGIGLPVAS